MRQRRLSTLISSLVGKSQNKLTPEELDILQSETDFKEKELKQWYRHFLLSCPQGRLSYETFIEIFAKFFPFGDPAPFARIVFDAFDEDRNNSIVFGEFMKVLSVCSRGSRDKKLRWAFKLYDTDCDGYITKEEMLEVMSAIYRMVGGMVRMPVDEDTPEKRVEKIFMLMDKDHDGKLSLQDFIQGAQEDESIERTLKLYEHSV
ncbi:uncharacterized protein VTP21DRAFT_4266 [Calcarisporiella thermophila]|uniref:uncharacterized protein n=1 Tax=Calcarisporiella thermophila TaxID=911321 RepID=UPI0037433927